MCFEYYNNTQRARLSSRVVSTIYCNAVLAEATDILSYSVYLTLPLGPSVELGSTTAACLVCLLHNRLAWRPSETSSTWLTVYRSVHHTAPLYLVNCCICKNKKAVQRLPRNAPYTWAPWKCSGLPDYAHGYYSQHVLLFRSTMWMLLQNLKSV